MAEPGEGFEYREETLADGYLGQALDALMDCGDARKLGLVTRHRKSDDAETARDRFVKAAVRRMAAAEQRLSFARTSILFSALAAESYINHFLHVMLRPTDAEALDRLTPPDRFIVGPQVALGEALFTRDREPMGYIIRLFRLRNELVHPKTQVLRVRKDRFYGADLPAYGDYNPEAAADFLMAVAQAAVTLAGATEGKADIRPLAADLLRLKKDVRAAGKHWRRELPRPPSTLARLVRETRRPDESAGS